MLEEDDDEGHGYGRIPGTQPPPLGLVIRTLVTAVLVLLALVMTVRTCRSFATGRYSKGQLPLSAVVLVMAVGYVSMSMAAVPSRSLALHFITWALASTTILVTIMLPTRSTAVVAVAVLAMLTSLLAAAWTSRGNGEDDEDGEDDRRARVRSLLSGAALSLYILALMAIAWAIPRLPTATTSTTTTARVTLALFGIYPLAYVLLRQDTTTRDGALAVLDLAVVAGVWLTSSLSRFEDEGFGSGAGKEVGMTADIRSHMKVVHLSCLCLEALFAMFLYHYVTRLERIGCECAMDGSRVFIKYFAVFLFSVVIVQLILLLTASETAYMAFSAVMAPVLMVTTVFYVVYVIKYINRLRREKCACSATISRSVIYVIAIIQAILYSFLALLTLTSILVLFFVTMSKK